MAANNRFVLPRMALWRPACVAGVLWASACFALADAPAERARVLAQQQRLEASFAAETEACRERFAVTACVEEVRLRRRDMLAPLRAQSRALDEAELRARADAKRQLLKDKEAQRTQTGALLALPQAKSRPAPTPSAVRPDAAASAALIDLGARRVAAARSADSARTRQARALADQERVAQRVQQRQAQAARKGRAVAPLPVPGAASSAR